MRLVAGLRPDPLEELKRSSDLLAAIRGPTSKGRGRGGDGERRGRRREGRGRGGEKRGKGRGKGRGRTTCIPHYF